MPKSRNLRSPQIGWWSSALDSADERARGVTYDRSSSLGVRIPEGYYTPIIPEEMNSEASMKLRSHPTPPRPSTFSHLRGLCLVARSERTFRRSSVSILSRGSNGRWVLHCYTRLRLTLSPLLLSLVYISPNRHTPGAWDIRDILSHFLNNRGVAALFNQAAWTSLSLQVPHPTHLSAVYPADAEMLGINGRSVYTAAIHQCVFTLSNTHIDAWRPIPATSNSSSRK